MRQRESTNLGHACLVRRLFLITRRKRAERAGFEFPNLRWGNYLGDVAQATSILDRLMHRSVLVEFRGKSYRLKEAASRLVKENSSE